MPSAHTPPLPRSADLLVIGAGIVGLAMADSWLAREPTAHVVVVDKEPRLAAHASGRNSGVLHAGFYYAPDSLKAKLTRDGNAALREFCRERGVAVHPCGKVVVTSHEGQLPALAQLLERGQANGVELERIDEKQLWELEPLAKTVGAAIWSPNTAVADPVAVVESLANRVWERGGHIHLGAQVTQVFNQKVSLATGESLSFGHMINAAGLYADTIAHQLGVGLEYQVMPFKGLYWYGDWPVGRLQRHIYPVPDPRNPFLGVHFTVTVNGRAKIGPTAIPALWRENYRGLTNFKAQEVAQLARLYPRFLRSKHHDSFGLIRTELPKYSRRHLLGHARALVPSVRSSDFTERGKAGIRAQLLHIPTGKLEMDFVVESGPRSTHVLNAVSPAWTSALAVGDYVVDRILAGNTNFSVVSQSD